MAWPELNLVQTAMLLCLLSSVLLKEIDSKSDLLQEESMTIPAEHRAYADLDLPSDLPVAKKNVLPPSKYEPSSNEVWPFARSEASQIKAINVKCEKNLMKVNIEFDRPFHGLIFSKGHYSDPKCVHMPAGTGQLQANFEIYLGSCGMSSSEQTSAASSASSLGLFIENTIIVQYDPQVQEIWDQARKLRCTWYDFYEKAVTFRPFNVDMLDAVTANFLGDNIQCWMQIQVGKGPWASEVAGIVKIGQTMTMVLAIKDEENKFDMLVRNCIAHDGKHQPIQLVDEYGCIVRSKIMSRFQKVKNFGHSATVVSYAYFQAFKFPDSMNVHFQCVIQVCRHECPQPTCEATDSSADFLANSRESQLEGDKKFVNRIGDIAPSSTERSANRSSTIHWPVTSESSGIKQNVTRANYAISGTGGMPRSLDLNKLRRKRETATAPKTDISTEKVIQVVAPGDVAFSLPLSGQESVVPNDVVQRRLHYENGNVICLSTSGFVAGLVLLVLLLLLTCIITVFLIIRLRNLPLSKDQAVNYQCPNHPNVACSCQVSLVQPQFYLQIPASHLTNIS